jgi:hypothetical protein
VATQADTMQQLALSLEGEEYTWGDEPWFVAGGAASTADPYDTDCSGLVYGCYRKTGVLWKTGSVWPRLTAQGYKYNAVACSPPYRVGDVVCFWDTSGHAYHIVLYIGIIDGYEYTMEARGKAWGVVKYKINDPVNGVIARHGHFMRFNWVNLGELTPTGRRELKIGMNGADVKEAQTKLNSHLGKTVAVDGIFGSLTLAATELFQDIKNLQIDGIVGKLTWAELDKTPTFPQLKKGVQTDYVKLLKVRLNRFGSSLDITNNFFGDATEAEVKKFQRSKGLQVDGIVGPKTWGELIK